MFEGICLSCCIVPSTGIVLAKFLGRPPGGLIFSLSSIGDVVTLFVSPAMIAQRE